MFHGLAANARTGRRSRLDLVAPEIFMQDNDAGAWRARQALERAGVPDADLLIALLREAGVQFADRAADQMVCRWVPVSEQAVPATADTIIRTITRTRGEQTSVRTYWLDGLRGPVDRD